MATQTVTRDRKAGNGPFDGTKTCVGRVKEFNAPIHDYRRVCSNYREARKYSRSGGVRSVYDARKTRVLAGPRVQLLPVVVKIDDLALSESGHNDSTEIGLAQITCCLADDRELGTA